MSRGDGRAIEQPTLGRRLRGLGGQLAGRVVVGWIAEQVRNAMEEVSFTDVLNSLFEVASRLC